MSGEKNLRDVVEDVKRSFVKMSVLTEKQKNLALEKLAALLTKKKDFLVAANQKDLEENRQKISQSLFQRLILDEEKIESLIKGIHDLVNLSDPGGQVLSEKNLDPNLVLTKVSVPIGLIGVIFEARPEAMVQILSLVLKSGNTAILKGGKEAMHTNQALAEVFSQLSDEIDFLPKNWCRLLYSRADVQEILKFDDLIDLVIPRGSNELVRQVMSSTKIPVLGHADGICHIYVDRHYDKSYALDIIVNAKTQYPAACNAVETVLVDEKVANSFVPELLATCHREKIKIYGCSRISQFDASIEEPENWSKEYSDLEMAIKVVSDVDEAVEHINTFGSGHTDAILSEDSVNQDKFTSSVDSACVFVNVSTRFADGFRFGMGAEVGISTSKTHARGPVGLDGLMTYKYCLVGKGQTVS